ncbi:MAG: hypothetical protein VKP62_01355 [Candidatus Sericytochromatia bacterium]|nr:hypothetical protein [Candidatus Sericytochromatia bacterium]
MTANLPRFRDKAGRVVSDYPFFLVIDPILNQGRIYPDETSIAEDLNAQEWPEALRADTVLSGLTQRGWQFHHLRSDADWLDALRPYFLVTDAQLQEALAANWVSADFTFPGAEHVCWEATTVQLYTDGAELFQLGEAVVLRADTPDAETLRTFVLAWLNDFARRVAGDLKLPLTRRPSALGPG